MSFFNTERPASSTFRKTEHIDLTPGQTTIRILDTPEEAYKYYTHYVKGVYIKCIGEDCPICQNNTKIYATNPKNFRDVPGYSPKSARFAVNVLDKTMVKICKNCHTAVKKVGSNYPPVCPNCNVPIVTEQEAPLNQVKVLAKGVTLADLLNGIDESVQDTQGNKIGINNFDIILYVSKTGRDQTISTIPLVDKNEPAVYKPEDKFDLTKIAVELTPEEIDDLLKGISLSDIFKKRNALESISKAEAAEPAQIAESVQNDINNILK